MRPSFAGRAATSSPWYRRVHAPDTDAEAYRAWMQRHSLSYGSVLDPNQQTTSMYPTTGVPETYVLDRQGHIVRKFIGPQDWTSQPIVSYLQSL